MDKRWRGVLVSDKQLEQEESKRAPSSSNFIMLDNIVLDKDEQEYMNMTYKFREIEPMSYEQLENEMEILSLNLRYELMGNTEGEDEDDEDMNFEEKRSHEQEKAKEKERSRQEYKESTNVLNTKEAILDMTKLKVTNLSKIPRLHEPRAAINNEEIRIQTRDLRF